LIQVVGIDWVNGFGRALADIRVRGIPLEVVANVEVEVAVVVEIGERGRGWPVAIAPETRTIRDVLEGSITMIPVKSIRSPAGNEEVGVPVVVEVADGHPVAVASFHLSDPRLFRGILEGAIAT